MQCNRRPRPTGRGEDDLGALELRACRDSLKPRTQCSPRRKETEREERKEGGIEGRRIERDRGTKSGSFPRKLLRTALLLAQAHFPCPTLGSSGLESEVTQLLLDLSWAIKARGPCQYTSPGLPISPPLFLSINYSAQGGWIYELHCTM